MLVEEGDELGAEALDVGVERQLHGISPSVRSASGIRWLTQAGGTEAERAFPIGLL
jgi:hypothetical protein